MKNRKRSVLLLIVLAMVVGTMAYRLSVRYSAVGLRPLHSSGPEAARGSPLERPEMLDLENLPDLRMTSEDFQQFAGGSLPSSRTMAVETHGPMWDARIAERGGMPIAANEQFRQQLTSDLIIDFESDEVLHAVHLDFLSAIKSTASNIPIAYLRDSDVSQSLVLGMKFPSAPDPDVALAVRAIERRKDTSPTYEWVSLLPPGAHAMIFEWDEGIALTEHAVPEALRHVMPSTGKYYVAQITHDVVSRDGYARAFIHFLAQSHVEGGSGPQLLLTSLVSMSPIDRNTAEFIYGPER